MSFPSVQQVPDASGHYGAYGGKFVPETLMQPLDELEQAYFEARQDPAFQAELAGCSRSIPVGPPPFPLPAG